MNQKDEDVIIEKIVSFLFREFNDYNIQYCILRNYEGLPYDTMGHDIDILLKRRDRVVAYEILQKISNQFNVDWIRVGERQYVISNYLLIHSSNCFELLQIDFFFDLDWHGRTMLDSKYILDRGIKYNEISIPRPAHEALSSLFSSLIRGGFYKKRYHSDIKSFILRDEKEFDKNLKECVGKYANLLKDSILNDQFDDCEEMVPELRREITKNSFRRFPLKTIHDFLIFFYWEIRNRLYPSGNLIAVVGGTLNERLKVCNNLYGLISKYYKNEGSSDEFILIADNLFPQKTFFERCVAFWKFYLKKIRKQLNKTYGIIFCGYFCDTVNFNNGKFVKQPDLIIDLDIDTNQKYKSRTVHYSEKLDLEKEIILTIVENDNSRYPNLISKDLSKKETLWTNI